MANSADINKIIEWVIQSDYNSSEDSFKRDIWTSNASYCVFMDQLGLVGCNESKIHKIKQLATAVGIDIPIQRHADGIEMFKNLHNHG